MASLPLHVMGSISKAGSDWGDSPLGGGGLHPYGSLKAPQGWNWVEGGLGDSSFNPLLLLISGIAHRGKILCLRVVHQAFRAGESGRGWTNGDRVSAISWAVTTPLPFFWAIYVGFSHMMLLGVTCSFFFFSFLNYESMITHLQEMWKIQNKVTYSSTTYYNYF